MSRAIGILTGGRWDKAFDACRRVYDIEDTAPTITTSGGGQREVKIAVERKAVKHDAGVIFEEPVIGALRGRNPENPKSRKAGLPTQQMLEIKADGTSNALTTVQKDNLVVEPSGADIGVSSSFNPPPLKGRSRALAVKHRAGVILPDGRRIRVRKLTQRECFRLMGFTDEEFDKARAALNLMFYNGRDRSGSQLYKQAGNSIVVDVPTAIFGMMKGD